MEPREYDAMHRAEDEHWWYRGIRAVLSVLLKQASPDLPRLSLDLGCGTGGTLRHVRLGRHAVGVDASSLSLSYCRADGLPLLARASANLLPFRSGAFDRVVSLDVLCHRSVRMPQALTEARRVMKRGAVFVMNLPAHNILFAHHDLSVHTARRFSHGEIANNLRRSGLRPERITYWNFLLFPLELAYRIMDKCLLLEQKTHSEVNYTSPVVNAVFYAVVRLEAWVLRRIDLPVGLSIFAVARKQT